jgi:hypothetical protein
MPLTLQGVAEHGAKGIFVFDDEDLGGSGHARFSLASFDTDYCRSRDPASGIRDPDHDPLLPHLVPRDQSRIASHDARKRRIHRVLALNRRFDRSASAAYPERLGV